MCSCSLLSSCRLTNTAWKSSNQSDSRLLPSISPGNAGQFLLLDCSAESVFSLRVDSVHEINSVSNCRPVESKCCPGCALTSCYIFVSRERHVSCCWNSQWLQLTFSEAHFSFATPKSCGKIQRCSELWRVTGQLQLRTRTVFGCSHVPLYFQMYASFMCSPWLCWSNLFEFHRLSFLKYWIPWLIWSLSWEQFGCLWGMCTVFLLEKCFSA